MREVVVGGGVCAFNSTFCWYSSVKALRKKKSERINVKFFDPSKKEWFISQTHNIYVFILFPLHT